MSTLSRFRGVCGSSAWRLLLVAALSACGETAGVDAAENRERHKFGELYDLDKYKECKNKTPRNAGCERYRLVRQDNPEHWPNPNIPQPKWPDPPKESVYKRGMKGVDYWRALCKAEAGEFIYKVVEDVEGIYQIRPRKKESDYALMDRYVLEDPYGYGIGDEGWRAFQWFVGPTDKFQRPMFYLFFERPTVPHDIRTFERKKWHPSMSVAPPEGTKYQLYYGSTRSHDGMKTMILQHSDRIRSRYGFSWRGIARPHDRELGVGGGELVVVDLHTGEILGLRRGFILGAKTRNQGFVWTASSCPEYALMPEYGGRNRDGGSILWFITKVLRPKISSSYLPGG